MTKSDIIQTAMDEFSHVNDRRVLAFLGGAGAMVYIATRPGGNCELQMLTMVCIAVLTLGTVVALTVRPERAQEQPQAPAEVKL